MHVNNDPDIIIYTDAEPKERMQLPSFKDPNIKMGMWSIIKDNIGKDISKITVPVFFNDCLNLLQKCANSMEYTHIFDRACELQDPAKRLAYIATYSAIVFTHAERNCTKPFNPILGETFEYVNDDIECLTEQVSHHPPVTAVYCRGKKARWVLWNNQKTNTKFAGKCLDLHQQYRTYVELLDHNETYEIIAPCASVHNIIIGTTYIDIGGQGSVKILGNEELKCNIRYTKKGWLSRDEYKCEGEVVRVNDPNAKK